MATRTRTRKRKTPEAPRLPTLGEIEAEEAKRRAIRLRGSLAEFVKVFWDLVEPEAKLAWTWHLEAVCDHLQAVTEGRITRLLINIPPGHGKSLLVCVFWPAWEWLERPGTRRIFASHSLSFARRDSRRTRSLIALPEYQALIPKDAETGEPEWSVRGGSVDAVDIFDNSATGFRQITAVEAKGTGIRGHGVVCDDPLSAQEIASEPALSGVSDWWDGTMSSRLLKPKEGSRVIIMQRLHERDLSGHVLAKGTYDHLCLPSEYDPERSCSTSIGFTDPRTEPGELLNADYFPASVIAEAKIDLGLQGYAGQHGQSPYAVGGNIIHIGWLQQRYRYGTVDPATPGVWRIYGDLKNGSKQPKSSFAVYQVWFRPSSQPARRYLIEQVRGRWDQVEEEQELTLLAARFPQCGKKALENKADSAGVIAHLVDEVDGLVAIAAIAGSKADRLRACAHLFTAGNIWLPEGAPWLPEYVHELTAFPSAANDDQVDTTSLALNDWKDAGKSGFDVGFWYGVPGI